MANRNERELKDLDQYKPGVVLGGRWLITKLLDEGGFGRVYQVQDQKKVGFYAALKIESVNMDGGSAIKLEKSALMQIHKRGTRAHVPALYRTSKRKNICYMIVTLLGENLKRLKDKYFRDGYTLRTWSRIAIQCLYAIKVVHDSGFVHRDIKACNFMLGASIDAKYARMVHILDFGLARQYAFEKGRKSGFRARPARPKSDFRGTFAYAAPSMHDGVEQGRKDDIWSFLYLLIDIYAGLPWARIADDAQLTKMKQNMRDEDLLLRMPSELLPIPKHLRTLGYYSRPDYTLVFNCLDKIMRRCNVTFLDPYEWETKAQATANRSAILNDYPGYIDAGPFFDEDPVKINEGPSGVRKKGSTTEDSADEADDQDIKPIPKRGPADNSMDVSRDVSLSARAKKAATIPSPARNPSKASKVQQPKKLRSKSSVLKKSNRGGSREETSEETNERKKPSSGKKVTTPSKKKKKTVEDSPTLVKAKPQPSIPIPASLTNPTSADPTPTPTPATTGVSDPTPAPAQNPTPPTTPPPPAPDANPPAPAPSAAANSVYVAPY